MSDSSGSRTPQSPSKSDPSSIAKAPYEAILVDAFKKLSSEVLIFLLAYVILLIGIAVFGSELADTLRTLLYIIPVLGVSAYVWLRQKEVVKQAKEEGIDVKAILVRNSGKVVGVRGAKAGMDVPKNVSVGAGLVSGGAEVGGVIYGDTEREVSSSSSLQVMSEIFNQLNKGDQIKLIASAQQLLDQDQKDNA